MHEIATEAIVVQHAAPDGMFLEIVQGSEGIDRRQFLCQIGAFRKIVNHAYNNGSHDHSIGNELIFAALVRGRPASQAGGKNGSEERHKKQHEANMDTGHDGAAEREAKFLETPGETKEHLQQKKDHDEAGENVAAAELN